jgi:hypothetical protein
MTATPKRRGAPKAARQAIADGEKALGQPITPQLIEAGHRAVTAYEAAKAEAIPAGQLEALIDDLVERGAPDEVVEHARYLVDMAGRFDVEFSPTIAAAAQMAPALGIDLDVGEMMTDRDRIRAQIAEGLRYVFEWQPGEQARK